MKIITYFSSRQFRSTGKLFSSFVCFCLLFVFQQASAQLSDLHYLPPLKMSQNDAIFDVQTVYLSTPETTTFDVSIYQGTTTTPVAIVTVSNAIPATYVLPGDNNDITMVSAANTGIVLQNSGLRFESENGELFYVSFRGNSTSQGEALTSKGRTAMGTSFKWGSIPTIDTSTRNSNHNAVMGIMAAEDNTTVTISDYDTDCTFRLGSVIDGITDDVITITLNANETFVLEAPMFGNPTNRSGTIGANIVSSKPIVLSNGNLMVNRIQAENLQDVGIDQAVPIDMLGREYVFMRGNGDDDKELPLIIATENNTRVFVNDATTADAILNEGEYFLIDGSNYSGSSAGDNMYVRASKNAYAYQLTAGADGFPNLGMNFISPVSCLMPRSVDNIALIEELPSKTVTGGITLLATTSTPDANIIVTDGNGIVSLPTSKIVSGTTSWKTFYISGLTGNVSVNSSGPISVGYIGFNGAIGTASYFSGFDDVPVVEYTYSDGDAPGCLGSTIEVVDVYDGYQWYQNDELVLGATGVSFTPTEIGEVYVEVVSGVVEGGACVFNSNSIGVYYCDPEIVLTKTVDQQQVEIDDIVTFTIEVQSLGIDDITNLNIEDALPEGLTLIDAVPTKGSWVSPNWFIGTMTAGERQSIALTASVDFIPNPSVSNVITNTAYNTQDQTDANREEDSPSASVIIGDDADNDGVKDDIDLDDDNDGILDIDETNGDTDGDGIPNHLDLDSDNDGIPDITEAGGIDLNGNGRIDYLIENDPMSMPDDNANGVDDAIEAEPLVDYDTDEDGFADRIDVDADNDGLTDAIEVGGQDANGDGQIDGYFDANLNGLSDAVETNPLLIPNTDENENDGPDYLDIDSDDDGIPDNVEIQTTFEYIAPSGAVGVTGLDLAYEKGFEPIDSDFDGIPDYVDVDSDNDELLDVEEAAIGSFTGIDTDGDGLDDGFEGRNVNDSLDVNDEIEDPALLPDNQQSGGDVDFRQSPFLDPCDPTNGTLPNGEICDILIDNDSVGPQIDEGFFRILNIEMYPENTVKVYNRWGVVVFETSNYINGSNDFRGVSTGRATISQSDELPSGVYFYLIEYVKQGERATKKGYIYVVR